MVNGSDNTNINNEELARGAKDFEIFWLRPKKMANKEAIIRMQINAHWGGWKLKDGLVESLGLEVGDTINTEVSVQFTTGLIRQENDTDLFASGEGADWLLDNNIGPGSVIDAKVRFVYAQAPVGGPMGNTIWKLSLVFLEGYSVIQQKSGKKDDSSEVSSEYGKKLERLFNIGT